MSICHSSCIFLGSAFRSLLEDGGCQTIHQIIERVIKQSADLQNALIKYHQIDYDDRTDAQEQQLNNQDDAHWCYITPFAAAIATCSLVSLDILDGRERITFQEQPEDEVLEEIMALLGELQDAHEQLSEVFERACSSALSVDEIREGGKRWLEKYIAYELVTSVEGAATSTCQNGRTA